MPAEAQRPNEAPIFLLARAANPLPSNARALIVQTAGERQPDLVVLAPDAEAQHIAPGAIALLRDLRARERPARTRMYVLTVTMSEGSIDPKRTARYQKILDRVNAGTTRDIAGVGPVRVIVASLADV